MKFTKAPTKIVGLALGELNINLIRPKVPMTKATFALLTEDGPCGQADKLNGWSQKTEKLLADLIESMEVDALGFLFKEDAAPEEAVEAAKAENASEPPQF